MNLSIEDATRLQIHIYTIKGEMISIDLLTTKFQIQ